MSEHNTIPGYTYEDIAKIAHYATELYMVNAGCDFRAWGDLSRDEQVSRILKAEEFDIDMGRKAEWEFGGVSVWAKIVTAALECGEFTGGIITTEGGTA